MYQTAGIECSLEEDKRIGGCITTNKKLRVDMGSPCIFVVSGTAKQYKEQFELFGDKRFKGLTNGCRNSELIHTLVEIFKVNNIRQNPDYVCLSGTLIGKPIWHRLSEFDYPGYLSFFRGKRHKFMGCRNYIHCEFVQTVLSKHVLP